MVSFSEGNGQQEILVVLPPFGWVQGAHGTFYPEPRRDRPWMAVLSRAERGFNKYVTQTQLWQIVRHSGYQLSS